MTAWKPVEGHIMTEWAAALDPACPLPEYPRPQMVREDWQNLNGIWEYCTTDKDADQPGAYDRSILVPYAVESALSGVKQPLLPDQRLWYRRPFRIPDGWSGKRILLHFEAVAWESPEQMPADFKRKKSHKKTANGTFSCFARAIFRRHSHCHGRLIISR